MGPLLSQYLNGTHDTADCLKRVLLLVTQRFRHFRPLVAGVTYCDFFIFCGRSNQERSSLPVLTVLPLLAGEKQEEGEGVKNERDGTSEGGIPQRSFFVLCDRSTFLVLLRVRVMDLLKACDEMKDFIEAAQKLVDVWDADPENYSQLEEGLPALKAALQK